MSVPENLKPHGKPEGSSSESISERQEQNETYPIEQETQGVIGKEVYIAALKNIVESTPLPSGIDRRPRNWCRPLSEKKKRSSCMNTCFATTLMRPFQQRHMI